MGPSGIRLVWRNTIPLRAPIKHGARIRGGILPLHGLVMRPNASRGAKTHVCFSMNLGHLLNNTYFWSATITDFTWLGPRSKLHIHSAPILHGYYCGLGNENCGGMSQLQPEQKAHCQPSRGLIIHSECRSSSFTDKCIINEKLITTCWNCSSIQRQLSAC